MATVSFKGASRIYPGNPIPAVEKLDLEIEDGEFMVLVGPSGSGKSTALRMLAGLEEVDEGSVYIGDRDVTHRPPKERDIAMVFQMATVNAASCPISLTWTTSSPLETWPSACGSPGWLRSIRHSRPTWTR